MTHDGLGAGKLVGRPTPSTFMLEFGEGEDAYLVSVDLSRCQGSATNQQKAVPAAAGAGSSSDTNRDGKRRRRSGGGRKRKALSPDELASGLKLTSTKAELDVVRKRRKREESAIERGRPLKSLRAHR